MVFISHKLLLKHNIWLPLVCSSSILLQLEAKLVKFRSLCQDLRANTNINYKLRDSKTVWMAWNIRAVSKSQGTQISKKFCLCLFEPLSISNNNRYQVLGTLHASDTVWLTLCTFTFHNCNNLL